MIASSDSQDNYYYHGTSAVSMKNIKFNGLTIVRSGFGKTTSAQGQSHRDPQDHDGKSTTLTGDRETAETWAQSHTEGVVLRVKKSILKQNHLKLKGPEVHYFDDISEHDIEICMKSGKFESLRRLTLYENNDPLFKIFE